ncbi:MAG: TRAP transporter substrate-binding protein DctP [Dehalococcoidia bacterium]|jgi:TRAP-type C4-dicarboxylate transport system substrate-binding protein
MKKALILLVALVLVVMSGGLFAACDSDEGPAEPVVLKMASAALFEYGEIEQEFADNFNARCGPDYTIEYYGAEQMVSFAELLDAVRTGAAEMGAITPSANSADDARLGANEIPFLFNNIDAHIAAMPALEELYADLLEDQFNQKLLCLHNYTAVELFSADPVTALSDWDGLLVQAISPTTSGLIDALGGAPVPLDYTESYGALEKGTVEAVITAPAAGRIFGLPDVAPYLASCYMVAAIHGFTINLDVWNDLPGDIQDILVEEAKATSDDIDTWLKSEWAADFADLESLGVTIHVVPQDEIDLWKAAASDFIDSMVATLGDFGQEVIDIAEDANEQYPR